MTAAMSDSAMPDSDAAQAAFARDYDEAFEGFVRSMRRQGYLIDDRIVEAAHVRAEKAAKERAMARGDRSLPFRVLTADCLARARRRHGY